MVIVDTSAWIEAFRHEGSDEKQEVDRLLAGNQVMMVGVVIAEVLQGARTEAERVHLEEVMSALPYTELSRAAWTKAGELSFRLRVQGRSIPLSDLLIAVLAIENAHSVYAVDRHFGRIPGLELYKPGTS